MHQNRPQLLTEPEECRQRLPQREKEQTENSEAVAAELVALRTLKRLAQGDKVLRMPFQTDQQQVSRGQQLGREAVAELGMPA
jgi:hypothetical protein